MSHKPAPGEVAASLPDIPKWVETRWILRSSGCRIICENDFDSGYIATHADVPLGAVVGRPAIASFDVLREHSAPFELVVQEEEAAYVREQLPDWKFSFATMHVRGKKEAGIKSECDSPMVSVSSPPDPELLRLLHPSARIWASVSEAFAVWLSEGRVLSVCGAVAVTEAYWDVGVITFPEFRRRGYARACFEALERVMVKSGKEPIWGAIEDNVASMTMARSLGFVPQARVGLLEARANEAFD